MAMRFVAGETLDEAIEAVRELNRQGMLATLDHLGENVATRDEAIDRGRRVPDRARRAGRVWG